MRRRRFGLVPSLGTAAWQVRLFTVLGMLLMADLLWFAYGRSAQCDPALYFPPIPALDHVAQSPPGRIIGANCLPAAVASMRGLRDIRGDDGVDPTRLFELLTPAVDPQSSIPSYALMQWLAPKAGLTAGGELQLPPILDMLGVRYVIFRGSPPAALSSVLRGWTTG